jgi:microcystin degradation protein MlrC
MTRIAVGGFLHETNAFAPTKASYDDFVHGGGWPAVAMGPDVHKTMRHIKSRSSAPAPSPAIG